jgi:hypothetical protein
VSVYSTIVFIDAMVALQGKPLASQQWHQIDARGPILVMVVPQVMQEIDTGRATGVSTNGRVSLGAWFSRPPSLANQCAFPMVHPQ